MFSSVEVLRGLCDVTLKRVPGLSRVPASFYTFSSFTLRFGRSFLHVLPQVRLPELKCIDQP